ncbi:winged helix-turn-helix transcriptional regulator [Nonomuraea sp. NN258]|nr:winged helix-turn-helix transcriptional regulator [Nonomuraea antri]
MRMGEEALPTVGLNLSPVGVRSSMVVAADIDEHPGTSVREIAERTGLVQSLVSASVARLRDAGVVVTETDPNDRRRTLVRHAPDKSPREMEVEGIPVDHAVISAFHAGDDEEAAQVVAALETLSARLATDALPRFRAGLQRGPGVSRG